MNYLKDALALIFGGITIVTVLIILFALTQQEIERWNQNYLLLYYYTSRIHWDYFTVGLLQELGKQKQSFNTNPT